MQSWYIKYFKAWDNMHACIHFMMGVLVIDLDACLNRPDVEKVFQKITVCVGVSRGSHYIPTLWSHPAFEILGITTAFSAPMPPEYIHFL